MLLTRTPYFGKLIVLLFPSSQQKIEINSFFNAVDYFSLYKNDNSEISKKVRGHQQQ